MLLWNGFDPRELQEWFQDLGPWAPVLFAVLGIAAMTVLIPKTLVSITAGALFGTGVGSALMLLVAIMAAALNYSIGRWWLHDSITRRLSRPQSEATTDSFTWLQAVAGVAADAGFQFHLLIRLLPIPTTLISYTMGATGSKKRPFFLAAAVAVIPQMLWVHGGTAASMIDEPSGSRLRWLSIFVSIFAAVAISLIVPKQAMKRVQAMKQSQQ
ncbi:MAG: TVP38/TMEM64 family protein [Rubripirellula sp.]